MDGAALQSECGNRLGMTKTLLSTPSVEREIFPSSRKRVKAGQRLSR